MGLNGWILLDDTKPEIGEEVLILIDGHRGPSWCNTYQLVAYLGSDGLFHEERHDVDTVAGVFAWRELPERIFLRDVN